MATTLLAVGLAACGSSSKSSSSSSSSNTTAAAGAATASGATITIQGFAFTAATVKPGAKVTVDNKDSTTHTVTADKGEFNTGNVDGGTTATFTAPSKPGSYAFHCNIHSSMHGTLTVTA